jgi:hypothetical protein
MSRSRPHENGAPNPATRWLEWNGEKGEIRYFDKEKKENVVVPLPFTFLLLDQLGTVRGWHDASQSGIYSNEVKDTRQDMLIVKAFKLRTPLAEGLYRDIKDRVNAAGGKFNANCYIAFKNGNGLKIGALRFKGAALSAWSEFSKQHRGDLNDKAVTIVAATAGKKGRITYYTPEFQVKDVSAETNEAAVALDDELQRWLDGYLQRTTHDRAEQAAQHLSDEEIGDSEDDDDSQDRDYGPPVTDDDIPF